MKKIMMSLAVFVAFGPTRVFAKGSAELCGVKVSVVADAAPGLTVAQAINDAKAFDGAEVKTCSLGANPVVVSIAPDGNAYAFIFKSPAQVGSLRPASGKCGRYGTTLRSNGHCALCQTTRDANYRYWPMFFIVRDGAEEFGAMAIRSDVEYMYNEKVGSGVCAR